MEIVGNEDVLILNCFVSNISKEDENRIVEFLKEEDSIITDVIRRGGGRKLISLRFSKFPGSTEIYYNLWKSDGKKFVGIKFDTPEDLKNVISRIPVEFGVPPGCGYNEEFYFCYKGVRIEDDISHAIDRIREDIEETRSTLLRKGGRYEQVGERIFIEI